MVLLPLNVLSFTISVPLLEIAPPKTPVKTQRRNYNISGKRTVKDDVNDSIEVAPTDAQAIAVVQQDQQVIAPGTRVAVIYSDDRPRIVPMH